MDVLIATSSTMCNICLVAPAPFFYTDAMWARRYLPVRVYARARARPVFRPAGKLPAREHRSGRRAAVQIVRLGRHHAEAIGTSRKAGTRPWACAELRLPVTPASLQRVCRTPPKTTCRSGTHALDQVATS